MLLVFYGITLWSSLLLAECHETDGMKHPTYRAAVKHVLGEKVNQTTQQNVLFIASACPEESLIRQPVGLLTQTDHTSACYASPDTTKEQDQQWLQQVTIKGVLNGQLA